MFGRTIPKVSRTHLIVINMAIFSSDKPEGLNFKISSTMLFGSRMLLAFIFIPLLQKELDTFKNIVRNTHRIRAQKETALASIIPNHVYCFPEEYDLEECCM